MEEQIKSSQIPIKEVASTDSLTNFIKIGNIELRSPFLSVQELTGLALQILKDKSARAYLEAIKTDNTKSGRPYFG